MTERDQLVVATDGSTRRATCRMKTPLTMLRDCPPLIAIIKQYGQLQIFDGFLNILLPSLLCFALVETYYLASVQDQVHVADIFGCHAGPFRRSPLASGLCTELFPGVFSYF